MLKRIIEALSALLEDTPMFGRLLNQMKKWGETQEAARAHFVSVLSNVVATFEKSHSIVLIELSRLTGAKTPEEYNDIIQNRIDRSKFYELFKTNDVCRFVHELQADLNSGFGDIKDSLVLGAAKELTAALGTFEKGEYSLAEQYADYVRDALLSPFSVNSSADLKKAQAAIIEQESTLAAELRELTQFKRKIFSLSL